MYDLRHGKEAQACEIGIKEVWRVEGEVCSWQSTHPRPCTPRVPAGGIVYPMADGPVGISLVVGLDYKIRARNITLFRVLLGAGTCLAYGARALTEGGLRSLLRLDFPGWGVGWPSRIEHFRGSAYYGTRYLLGWTTESSSLKHWRPRVISHLQVESLRRSSLVCRYPVEICILAALSGASTSVFAFETTHLSITLSLLHYPTLSPTHSCALGVVNTAKMKGMHDAMRMPALSDESNPNPRSTGMRAVEAAFAAPHPAVRFVLTASPAPFEVGVGGINTAEKFHQGTPNCSPSKKATLPSSSQPALKKLQTEFGF
ncbi:hypothetical protein K438DRAFT_2058368 [Mycena galopus ATCC 62051]|nr:hypothetical protein K438DRAFT_2058368 [Mycena galopus ATCC 62051]